MKSHKIEAGFPDAPNRTVTPSITGGTLGRSFIKRCIYEDECTDYPRQCLHCQHNKMKSYFKPNNFPGRMKPVYHTSSPMRYKSKVVKI